MTLVVQVLLPRGNDISIPMDITNSFAAEERVTTPHYHKNRLLSCNLETYDFDMSKLFRFSNTVRRDPAIKTWMNEHDDELGSIAKHWFDILRNCGNDVQELLHDDNPTVCVEEAAFAYVNTFKAHVNVGFFHGAEIDDPHNLLEGTGKFMRHVKLRPNREIDTDALSTLIETAYLDIKERLKNSSA